MNYDAIMLTYFSRFVKHKMLKYAILTFFRTIYNFYQVKLLTFSAVNSRLSHILYIVVLQLYLVFYKIILRHPLFVTKYYSFAYANAIILVTAPPLLAFCVH